MNSARRDLQALGVLDSRSGNDALFSTHPADMTDEQLDAALALIERRQPGLSCSEENESGEIEPAEREVSPVARDKAGL